MSSPLGMRVGAAAPSRPMMPGVDVPGNDCRAMRCAAPLVMSVVALLFAGCSGGPSALTPKLSAPSGPSAQAMTRTAESVSPARFSAQPMPRTAVLSAAVMLAKRRPQSDVVGVGFTQIPGGARDIAVAPDGSLWVVSNVYAAALGNSIWHYANGNWTNIPGLATRIAVAPDSSLWAVNGSGGIYHYASGNWSTIAGGASDLSVGPDGSVYVISSVAGGPQGNDKRLRRIRASAR